MKCALLLVTTVALAGLTPACAQNTQLNPRVVSSSRQSAYVEEYPAVLEGTTKGVVEKETRAKAIIEAMPTYSKELKGADPARVLAIVNAADESGRSGGYVERAHELAGVSAFFDDARDPVTRRTIFAASKVIKEKPCEVDVSGPIAYSIKDGVDKEMEKALRARNEAHAIIDKQRTALGRENAEKLEKQADAIAYASYVVNVALPEERVHLNQLVAERGDVESTIDRVLEEERVYQADKTRTPEERKASTDRVATLQKGKATLRAFGDDAKKIAAGLEQSIPQYQKAYEDALKALRADLKPAG